MNDYELVYLAQEHVDEAKDLLYKKYLSLIDNFIFKFLGKYNLNKIDFDDVKLECLLVFENVIDNFNQDKNSSFKTYLWTCLDSKLKAVFRMSNSKKNYIFNHMVSIDAENNGMRLIDSFYNDKDLVEFSVVDNYIDINKFFYNLKEKLSKREYLVLGLLIKGYLPDNIALILKINNKQVYNTIYRLKIKLKKEFDNYG